MRPVAPVPHVVRAKPRARTFLGRVVETLAAAAAFPPALLGALAVLTAVRLNVITRPGVNIEFRTRPGPSESVAPRGAALFLVTQAERGPVDEATTVRSMQEYREIFGERVTYSAGDDQATVFFGEGGAEMHVARVVGEDASLGTLTLNDRAGTPLATLRIDASSPGAWSSRVKIDIDDGVATNEFDLHVLFDNEVVESYRNLTSPTDAASALTVSSYVRGTVLASATAAPTNNPAVITATALSAGTDDRAAIVAADYVTALDLFISELGDGAVAIPGQEAGTVGDDLIAHAAANNRIALLAPAAAQTVAQVKALAAGLRSTAGAEHAGLFYPWVKITTGGLERTISPEGYVAGVRARAHRDEGPWRAPAGEIAAARYVADVETYLSDADGTSLNDHHVNAIRRFGTSVQLYGWRSLSRDTNYRFLNSRDLGNSIADQVHRRARRIVFRTVDALNGRFFLAAEAEAEAVLAPISREGGVFPRADADGNPIDPGYAIATGAGVNTPETLATGEARMNISYRPSPTAELITVTITQVAVDQPL